MAALTVDFPVGFKGTTVYRAYDAEGRLLYVGISDTFYARMGQHQASSPWWKHAVRLETEQFATRSKAMVEEARLIRTLAPAYNTTLQGPEMASWKRERKARRECKNGAVGCPWWATPDSDYCEACQDPEWAKLMTGPI